MRILTLICVTAVAGCNPTPGPSSQIRDAVLADHRPLGEKHPELAPPEQPMLANPYDEQRAIFLTCASRFPLGSADLRVCQAIGLDAYERANR